MSALVRIAAVLTLLAGSALGQVFPPVPEPAGNPTTPAKALLGKALFWDEQLSSTRTVACGTCHRWDAGGSDPRVTSTNPGPDGLYGTADDIIGSFGVVRQDATGSFVADPVFGVRRQVTRRRAPSPINAGYLSVLFWDGRADDVYRDPETNQVVLPSGAALEHQAAGPPVNDGEMGHIGRSWTDIAQDLPSLTPLALASNIPAALSTFIGSSNYAQLFQQVYGSPGVTPNRIIFAIAAYERTLVSDQSPFDLWLAGQGTLTPQENQGRQTFNALCKVCHTDVDNAVLTNGPVLNDFQNIGVRPLSDDRGRFEVTQVVLDQGKFKTPGLRNVELRAPYFHNGGMATLADVMDFYERGGDHFVNIAPEMFNIIGAFGPSAQADVEALMRALTDPRVANGLPPFDRPTLWSETSAVPTTFGFGTAGSGGIAPTAIALQPAFLGNQGLTIGVDATAPGAFAFVVWDLFSNASPTNVFGHNVYLAQSPAMTTAGVGFTQGSGTGGGFASTTLGLPANPAFAGAILWGQWLVVDPAGPVGFSSSNPFGLPLF